MSTQAIEVRERFSAESANWRRLYETGNTPSIYAENVRKRREIALAMLASVDGNILDLGCGTGAVSAEIIRTASRRVYGTDFSYDMLDAARTTGTERGCPLSVFGSDALALPIQPASFNGILALGVAEYTEQPERLITESHRILSPGGTLIISVPNRTSPFVRIDDAGKSAKNFVTRQLIPAAARRWIKTRLLGRDDKTYFNHTRHRFDPVQFESLLRSNGFAIAERRCHTYGFGVLDGFRWNLALAHRIERRITGNPSLERLGWTCILKAIRR